jgi:hypothetical protein
MSIGEVLYRVKTKAFTSIEKRKRLSEIAIAPTVFDNVKLNYIAHLSSNKIPEGNDNIFDVANNAVVILPL